MLPIRKQTREQLDTKTYTRVETKGGSFVKFNNPKPTARPTPLDIMKLDPREFHTFVVFKGRKPIDSDSKGEKEYIKDFHQMVNLCHKVHPEVVFIHT